MNLRLQFQRLKYLTSLLRTKGIGYTYNQIHFHLFYGGATPFFIKLSYWLEPYPSYIEIEVTTRCNLKCTLCEHTYWEEPAIDMSFQEFKSIVDQFPRLKWIGLTGIGESFLNKDFLRMLAYVKSKNVFVELYDTFFFIDGPASKELLRLGVDKLFISLDAASKDTYEKIRIGSSFEKVITNLREFMRLKKEMKAVFPKLSFHFIVTKDNVDEIVSYIEMAHALSDGEETGIQITRMLHPFEETQHLFVEVPEETIKIADAKAKELGIPLSWNLDVPQDKPRIAMCKEWTMPFIFVTGHVVPCCAGNEAGQRDAQKRTALGNVFEQSFKDIWRGKKYRALRRALRQSKAPLPCKNCCLYDTGKGQ